MGRQWVDIEQEQKRLINRESFDSPIGVGAEMSGLDVEIGYGLCFANLSQELRFDTTAKRFRTKPKYLKLGRSGTDIVVDW